MLAAVLSWLLLRHLPEKDRQIKQLLADKDAQLRALLEARDRQAESVRAEFLDALERAGDAHRDAVAEVGRHCREEIERFLSVFAGRAGPR